MDNFGFIHEKLDIKLLILFVLNRLPAPVDELTLSELCMFDSGVGYFDYTECLTELSEAELVTVSEEGYSITEKGSGSIAFVESSLPYTVRAKAERLLQPVEERMRREAMIVAKHTIGEDGTAKVELAVSDGVSDILHLTALCAGEEQAVQIEKNFRPNAEKYYQKIMELLSE